VRILVDGLWPRGVKKETARIARWAKELAPSTNLRRRFGHDPARWQEFQTLYRRELSTKRDALAELRTLAKARTVTLLFAARDELHNNAVVLKDALSGTPAPATSSNSRKHKQGAAS
jgi:uncharacterized protein YeaO (DUF488 family)